jgi:NAD(P)H-dependent flavin oxidoreductase YrpB (nitropropane dioxygenase family)
VQTTVTRALGIEHPVIQAPIGGLSNPRLAAAVSSAGGLGTIAMTWSGPDEIRDAVRVTRSLTDRPFGANLIIDGPQDERLAVILDEGVRIVSLFWGDPGRYVRAIRAAGAISLATVGSAEEARRAVGDGVDVIVAQGWEAGGHVWGGVSTMALVPVVVDAVPGTPVVAAGGIADGRGLAAALALGAGAAWMGTRFVASEEAQAHPEYLAGILAASETDTYLGTVFDVGWPGAPHRTLRNATIDAWLAAGGPALGSRPGEGDVVARRPDGSGIVRYSAVSATAGVVGAVGDLSLWAGQGVGLVLDVLPAAQIVRRVVSEAEEAMGRLPA